MDQRLRKHPSGHWINNSDLQYSCQSPDDQNTPSSPEWLMSEIHPNTLSSLMRRFSTLDIYFKLGSQRASYWSAPHESHSLQWAVMTAPDTSVHHVKVTLTVWPFSKRRRGSAQGMKVNQSSPAVCVYVHSCISITVTTSLSFKPHRVLTSSKGCLKGDEFRFRLRSGRYFVKTVQMNPNVFLNKRSGYYGSR